MAHQRLLGGRGQLRGRGVLGEERQSRDSAVPSDDRHGYPLDRHPRLYVHKLVGPDDVQGGDAADFHRVQAGLLVELGHGRNKRVQRIHDQAHDRIWAIQGTRLNHVLSYAPVQLQDVAVGPAVVWPPRASNHEVAASEALSQVIHRSLDRLQRIWLHLAPDAHVLKILGQDVGRRHGDGQVLNAKFCNPRIKREEQAQGLSNLRTAATNTDLKAFLARFANWALGSRASEPIQAAPNFVPHG
mmetsp:Transcript_149334/g.479552  ORF Transcript_149334/g.479552 Transcript_149334/m.479552 type:complete len:243 (-) Transcript_149334:59-787(-)